jgi:hypothetical protein
MKTIFGILSATIAMHTENLFVMTASFLVCFYFIYLELKKTESK